MMHWLMQCIIIHWLFYRTSYNTLLRMIMRINYDCHYFKSLLTSKQAAIPAMIQSTSPIMSGLTLMFSQFLNVLRWLLRNDTRDSQSCQEVGTQTCFKNVGNTMRHNTHSNISSFRFAFLF